MIIAEIGQNHCGDMALAKHLIFLARENGADLAKFQLYDHNILYANHPEIPDVALSFEQAKMLFDYGVEVGIEVFFSVFDIERVKWCEKIGVKRYKVAYSHRNNYNLLLSFPDEKELIISSDTPYRGDKTLYCIPHYPTEISELKLGWAFPVEYHRFDGLSDHTLGLDASKIILARGAQIIEKHFAIGHKTGVDAPWSMTPEELLELKRWETMCKKVLNA